jgi:hypothetical protein
VSLHGLRPSLSITIALTRFASSCERLPIILAYDLRMFGSRNPDTSLATLQNRLKRSWRDAKVCPKGMESLASELFEVPLPVDRDHGRLPEQSVRSPLIRCMGS